MKPIPPELEASANSAITKAARLARFEEMKKAVANRQHVERLGTPVSEKFHNPHNASILTPDLFARPLPKAYLRTDKAYPAGLNTDAEALGSIATITPKQALAEQTAKIQKQKKAKSKNKTPVDAFGDNPTAAKLRLPNGTQSDVTLTQGLSNGYKLTGTVDGKESFLSLNGAYARTRANLKNKVPLPNTDALQGLADDWEQQMAAKIKGRMKEHLAKTAATEEPGQTLMGSFRQLVTGAAKAVRIQKDSFVETVKSAADNAVAGGHAKR